MFSLRQCVSDFHVNATLELIRDIGFVDATANEDYFTRSFCVLESYAILSGKEADKSGKLNIHNIEEPKRFPLCCGRRRRVRVKSIKASARNDADAQKVRLFIQEHFGWGAKGFRAFDAELEERIEQSEENRKGLVQVVDENWKYAKMNLDSRDELQRLAAEIKALPDVGNNSSDAELSIIDQIASQMTGHK